MKRILAVIETPISAYLLALICDNQTVIDILYAFNKNNCNVEDVVQEITTLYMYRYRFRQRYIVFKFLGCNVLEPISGIPVIP